MKLSPMMLLTAFSTAALLTLSGCGAGGSSAGSAEGPGNGDKKNVKIAVFNGWDEGIAASELWKAALEKKGDNVSLEYAEPAPVYSGLSTGDYDVTLDTWLPITHKSYIDKYGADMEDLGSWNDQAKLTIAPNKDAPVDSLDELAANADKFGNRLVGIEPGAGLTEATTKKVIPAYGLDNMKYLTSSTPARLSELKAATGAGENTTVTLWRPHWAYDAFPLKDLADPKGTLGNTKGIHSYASKSFDKNFPALSGWIKDFRMDSKQLYSLENAMFNGEKTDDYGPAVQKWMDENKDFVASMTD